MDIPAGSRELPIERGHLQWLAGVLGLYTLSEPSDPDALRRELPGVALLRYPDEAEIIREGDSSGELFIIYSGLVRVLRGDRKVADLGPGSLLGEIGFLTHKPRSATVKVDGVCEAFRIEGFGDFLEKHPPLKAFMEGLAGRRLNELAELAKLSETAPPTTTSLPAVPDPARPAPEAPTEPPAEDSASTLGGLVPAAPAPTTAGAGPAMALVAGRYAVRRLIGRGGMGLVFLAHDRTLDRLVAIKQLREELSKDADSRRHFLREARLLAQLAHPFIVGIHDIVDDATGMYLVFDYIEGHPISRLIREKHLFTLQECCTVFHFVCQAVAYAHWHRVLHRDLKPSNIMIDRIGYAKVMDFGVARRAKDSLTRITQKDACGTPAFMAPEQHQGEFVPQSDIYALAVCFYEMLTGQIPFAGPDFVGQKQRQLMRPATALVNGLPQGIDEFFASALSPEPAKRPPDAMSFLKAVRKLAP